MEGACQRPREGLGEQFWVNQACKGCVFLLRAGYRQLIDPRHGRRVAAGLAWGGWGEWGNKTVDKDGKRGPEREERED